MRIRSASMSEVWSRLADKTWLGLIRQAEGMLVSKHRVSYGLQQISTSAAFLVDPEKRLVVVRFGKNLTVADVERYASMLRLTSSFHPSFGEIVDLTEVEEICLQADDFLTLDDKTDPFALEAKRAFVVLTSVQKHAARMHKILRTSRNIEIFHTFEDAEGWIEQSSCRR